MNRKRGVIYKAGPSNLALFFLGMALVSWLIFLIVSGYPVAAWVYYRFYPQTSSQLSDVLGKVNAPPDEGQQKQVEVRTLPPLDLSLPEGYRVVIPRIGVDSTIYEEPLEKYENALRRGVWRVPNFAVPDDTQTTLPLILVGHRFGYLEWTQEFRLKNSFFRLPKLQLGDEVEVVWNKRKFVYKVTRMEEGEDISEYDHDLILYTCKFLVSPVRVFVYADLVE